MQFTLYSLDDQRARLAALFADGPRHVRLFNYSITHSYAQLSIHDGFPFRRVPLYLMGVYSLCLGSVGAFVRTFPSLTIPMASNSVSKTASYASSAGASRLAVWASRVRLNLLIGTGKRASIL